MLAVKLLDASAKVPTKSSNLAAGFDLYALDDVVISPWSRALVTTGISIQIPEGCYGRIASRSGMALKGIDVQAGVIDRDYTGEIKILLSNSTSTQFGVLKGDRCAQLIIERLGECKVHVTTELTDTERGCAGFGSTGQ